MDASKTEDTKQANISNPWIDFIKTTPGFVTAVLGAISSITLTLSQFITTLHEKPWIGAVAVLLLIASCVYYAMSVRRRRKLAIPLSTKLFVGPRPLTAEDRARMGFFGRDHEVEEVVERLCNAQYRYMLLFGETGSGKSSLIQAGIIPALEQTGRYQCIYLRFFDRPIEEIREAFRSLAFVDSSEGKDSSAKIDISTLSPVELLRRARERTTKTIVLFIDQFEEIHINAIGKLEFQAIRDLVWNVAGRHASIDAKVVFSLRNDFLDLMGQFEHDDHLESIYGPRAVRMKLEHFEERTARNVLLSLLKGPDGPIWSPDLIERILSDLAIEKRVINGENRKIVLPTELQIVCQIVQAQRIQYAREYPGRLQIIRNYVADAIDMAPVSVNLVKNVLLGLTDDNGLTKAKPQTLARIAARVQSSDRYGLARLMDYLDKSRHLIHSKPQEGSHEIHYELAHDHLVRVIREIAGATLSGASSLGKKSRRAVLVTGDRSSADPRILLQVERLDVWLQGPEGCAEFLRDTCAALAVPGSEHWQPDTRVSERWSGRARKPVALPRCPVGAQRVSLAVLPVGAVASCRAAA